jgi:hypothetical protein
VSFHHGTVQERLVALDVPAFTSGGCLPLSFGEGFQMTLELQLLGYQSLY